MLRCSVASGVESPVWVGSKFGSFWVQGQVQVHVELPPSGRELHLRDVACLVLDVS